MIKRLFKRFPSSHPVPPESATLVSPDSFEKILSTVRPYTMVHETGVRFAAEQAAGLIDAGRRGVIVECGVWKGGCSMAMLMAQRQRLGRVVRTVHMLDSFSGLPPVDERDGPLARAWQDGGQEDKFFDNCSASEAELRRALADQGFREPDFNIHPGWFRDTLPGLVADVGDQGIALLRLDCDWYEPTMECLDALEPLVVEGGAIILDDYYAWDGFARATHDYLSKHNLPYRIKSLPYSFGAYMIKHAGRPDFETF